MSPLEWQAGLAEFFDQGGRLLWVILAVSTLMWGLIAERYWFHWREARPARTRLLRAWRARDKAALGRGTYVRLLEQAVAEYRGLCLRRVEVIETLTNVLPLVGLLGTVSGMIKVFEVITIFGTGNTRGMAAGIAEALLTTMAGLVTALSGLYFVTNLQGRAARDARELRGDLIEGKEAS